MSPDASSTPVTDERKAGSLYLVATPIGNLEDITVRALRLLGEVDLIACEDTRQTAKLLQHYGIHRPTISYHEHNEITRSAELVLRIEAGERVALVTDAGMPGISDPGYRLVSLCVRHQIPVVPVPGPSALLTALAASGLPAEEFVFVGFLPARAAARRKALKALATEPRTLVLYEAPHRLSEALADAVEFLGRRQAVIARELTKVHEEFLRGDLAELVLGLSRRPARGEITVLIAPAQPGEVLRASLPSLPIRERVEQVMREQSVDQKTALKIAARERGLTRREAYKQLLLSR